MYDSIYIIATYVYTRIHMSARARSLYLRLSAPRNYQGRPSPRQFVKAVIIPADLWHCIHIGRCLPPDQITSAGPRSGPSVGAPFSSEYHRGASMKTIHFESSRYYHRLGFDARFKLKPIGTRTDTRVGIQILIFFFSPPFPLLFRAPLFLASFLYSSKSVSGTRKVRGRTRSHL